MARKLRPMVDTDGRLLTNTAFVASIHDSLGGVALLGMAPCFWPFVERRFADRAQAGKRVAEAPPIAGGLAGAAPGRGRLGRVASRFVVQPRRSVLVRASHGSVAWIDRCRRPARGHEATVSSGTTFTPLAAATIFTERLAQEL